MNRLVIALLAGLALSAPLTASAVTKDEAVAKISDLVSKVSGFSADLEITETDGGVECVSSSTISVSKELGFKTTYHTNGAQCHIVTDYDVEYQYFPEQKRALKIIADHPEIRDLLRKPATDMNPLPLLDPKTLRLIGEEELDGQPVYHFEGTTTTQYSAQGQTFGDPIQRKLEAWISASDGLPRKTIEQIGPGRAVTLYRNVRINPSFTAKEFRFDPPSGVTIVDPREESQKAMRNKSAPPPKRSSTK